MPYGNPRFFFSLAFSEHKQFGIMTTAPVSTDRSHTEHHKIQDSLRLLNSKRAEKSDYPYIGGGSQISAKYAEPPSRCSAFPFSSVDLNIFPFMRFSDDQGVSRKKKIKLIMIPRVPTDTCHIGALPVS